MLLLVVVLQCGFKAGLPTLTEEEKELQTSTILVCVLQNLL